MSKTLFGADTQIEWANKAIATTRKKLITAFESSAEKMETSARNRNKNSFTSKKYDEAIKADVERKGDTLSLTFYIDTAFKGIILESDYNLLWLHNDGTYGNYRRGIISPSAVTVGGKKGTGLLGADFMGRTWRTQYKALDKRINKAMDGIR